MNRTLLTAASVFLACSFSLAQNGVIDTRAAHDGRDLTMEEAIFKGVGYSRSPRLFLHADGSVNEQVPSSPKEQYTLFQERGSLYARDNFREESFVIAPSDGPNLVFGETVSRNEFGIGAGWYMSPYSSRVAFYRKDQNKVKDYDKDIKKARDEIKRHKSDIQDNRNEIKAARLQVKSAKDDLRQSKTVKKELTK